jgi:hypothetical protein
LRRLVGPCERRLVDASRHFDGTVRGLLDWRRLSLRAVDAMRLFDARIDALGGGLAIERLEGLVAVEGAWKDMLPSKELRQSSMKLVLS